MYSLEWFMQNTAKWYRVVLNKAKKEREKLVLNSAVFLWDLFITRLTFSFFYQMQLVVH